MILRLLARAGGMVLVVCVSAAAAWAVDLPSGSKNFATPSNVPSYFSGEAGAMQGRPVAPAGAPYGAPSAPAYAAAPTYHTHVATASNRYSRSRGGGRGYSAHGGRYTQRASAHGGGHSSSRASSSHGHTTSSHHTSGRLARR